MLAPLCLRRSKQAIDLPGRTDSIHRVDFDAEEAAHYKSINGRVTGFLELQAGQTGLGSYSNILTKINSLRQICNLGTYYRGDIGVPETQTTAMQELFDGMISSGAAVCCKCDRDLSKGDENDESQIDSSNSFESSKTRIATCGELICASCFALSKMAIDPSHGRCQHQSSCELFTVNSSGSSDLPAFPSNSRLPVKMRALQEDLLALPETDKRLLPQSVERCSLLTCLPVSFSRSGQPPWILLRRHWTKFTYPTLVLMVRCLPSKDSWPSKALSMILVSVPSLFRCAAVRQGTRIIFVSRNAFHY